MIGQDQIKKLNQMDDCTYMIHTPSLLPFSRLVHNNCAGKQSITAKPPTLPATFSPFLKTQNILPRILTKPFEKPGCD